MKANLLQYAAGMACACACVELATRPSRMARLVMVITRVFRRAHLH